ncbi:cell division protein ZapA [Trichlorobacter ammonificans]|uniref:Cell division protein ZapA n=1 Tax=Trichlorobacter ammonificans TaxID=2916410 RepID=A0ABM9DBS5_9BACT|nr:cell division protein ZapA [Trichlorobacter ammonificans]CAH2032689.1 Cell division protein ZapA [Trichlorobacter ammonificans]
MKTTYQLTVLGRDIPVRSSAPEEQVRAVETFVNSRLADIQNRMAVADSQLVAILALLNLAEAYLEQQAAPRTDTAALDARIHRLLERLETALETPGLFRET